MRNFFPIIFGAAVILIFGLLEVALVRVLNKPWWHKQWIRRAAWGLPVAGMAAVILWGIGEYHKWTVLSVPAATAAALAFVLELALMLSLPISGFFHLVNRLLDRFLRHIRSEEAERPVDRKRRMALKGVAAAVPLVTLGTAASGIARGFSTARVYRKPIPIENLPPDLNGLRILQLSDLHLRTYVTLDDLEPVLEKVRPFSPHIVLVTGDIADDLTQLPGALDMIHELNAPLGTYASLGNHEYFRGIQNVRRIFDRSPVPLFVNEGTRIKVGHTDLYVSGIDDPRRMNVDNSEFFRKTIDSTLLDSRSDDFVILMSHRPYAFDHAVERNIRLTVSGHTHGGQIGLFDRSLFEELSLGKYFWGHYHRKQSHLYTTSGVGHWFPFRLNCPAEAPIIELVAA